MHVSPRSGGTEREVNHNALRFDEREDVTRFGRAASELHSLYRRNGDNSQEFSERDVICSY